MDSLNKLKLDIYESSLDNENKYELIDIINMYRNKINKNDIFTEKKTREEYRVERFKKKYNFKPEEPGSKYGTITVDDKNYKIRLDNRSFLDIDGNKNKTYADVINDEINIGRDFFKTKNSKRSNSKLQHEIGHIRMHSKTGDLYNDKNRIKDHLKKFEDKDIKHSNTKEFEADRYSINRTSLKDRKASLRDTQKFEKGEKEIKNSMRAERKDALSVLGKSASNFSISDAENVIKKIKTDLPKMNSSNRMRALETIKDLERAKGASRDNEVKEILKRVKTQGNKDIKTRMNVQKDKKLQNSKVYKKEYTPVKTNKTSFNSLDDLLRSLSYGN